MMSSAKRIAITGLIAAGTLYLPAKAQGRSTSDSILSADIQEIHINADHTHGAAAVSTEKTADAKFMQATGAMQVSDAVKFFSGATVKDYGGIGGLKTVSVRGLGASHTAVAYDGVIITDSQTGQTDLGRFSAGQTESVRLVSGPDNDMLQTASMAAQAAAVNMEGHRPQLDGQDFKGNVQLKYGSFGTIGAQASSDFKVSGNTGGTASVEWLKADGDYPYIQDNGSSSKSMYRSNSDIARLRAEAALYRGGGSSDFSLRAYWFQSAQGLPANILYNENAARERMWNRNGFVQSTLRNAISERLTVQMNAKYGVSWTRYLDPDVNSSAGFTDNRYTEQECYLSGVVMYRLSDCISASAAVDGRLSDLEGVQARPTRFTLNSSAALKYATGRIVLTGRMNHIYTTEHTWQQTAADGISHLSPAAGANVLIWPELGLHLRASYANTLRLPSFNDLYFEQVGRRDLKPERASVTSAGLIMEKEAGKCCVSIYADAYDSHVHDRIMAVPGKNTAVWMMKNIGLVTTHGLETGIEVSCKDMAVRPGIMMSYTYQRAMDKSEEGGTTWNHQLPYTPRHSASGVLLLETTFVTASLNVIYSGKYYCNAYNGPEYAMPSYYEAGCSLWRNMSLGRSRLCVKAECVNLTDSRYELVRNYPMPGRQFRLAATFEL